VHSNVLAEAMQVNKVWSEHWPPKPFHIAILDTQLVIGRSDGRPFLRVEVPDNPLCIYNNRGKDFFSWMMESSKEQNNLLVEKYDILAKDSDRAIRKALDVASGNFEEKFDLTETNLRWSSAGGLPIVRFHDQDWIALFYRDRKPVGWNVANGGSEKPEEWERIAELGDREFYEEFIVLREHVSQTRALCHQIDLHILGTGRHELGEYQKYIEFTDKFRNLRKSEHNLQIISPVYGEEASIELDLVKNAFDVFIRRGRSTNDPQPGFIPSINASLTDLGIETIRLIKVNLDSVRGGEKYIVDGEVNEQGNALITRPVMLLSLRYLRTVIDKYGSLGEIIQNGDSAQRAGGKCLPYVPSGMSARVNGEYSGADYIMFDYDAKHHKIQSIKSSFKKIEDEGKIESENQRTFCPVTWKTIEYALKSNII